MSNKVEVAQVVLEKILKCLQCIFAIISLAKECGSLFEQTWIHFTQGCYVPNLVENGPVVLNKKFVFMCCQCIYSQFHYYLPPDHLIMDAMCLLVEIGPVLLGKKMKM